MKIVDVTSFYSRNGGGIRTYLESKSRALIALGCEVHRVVPGARTGSRRAADGAMEHTVAGPELPLDRNYRCFGDLREVRRALHWIGPDVVEVGSHYVLPWVIRKLAPAGVRVVGFWHSNVPDTFVAPLARRFLGPAAPAAERGSWRVVRAMHARYDATLCASRVVEQRLRERAVPRVVRVGLGVDLERFGLRPGVGARGQLCYVGRLSMDKEATLLLEAAPRLRAAGLTLRVAGDGPGAAAFRQARDLEYLGAISSERVRELLWSSEQCLVPGRYETFSLAAAEALACGTPVVCPGGGAAAELACGAGAGEPFAAGQVDELVAAALRIHALPDAALRERAVAARRFAERELSWTSVARRLLAAYGGERVARREEAVA